MFVVLAVCLLLGTQAFSVNAAPPDTTDPDTAESEADTTEGDNDAGEAEETASVPEEVDEPADTTEPAPPDVADEAEGAEPGDDPPVDEGGGQELDEPAPVETDGDLSAEPAAADPADGSAESEAAETATVESDEEADVTTFAAGPPVYEIEGNWVNQPPNISRGEPVVAEWRVNVNDSGEPPSNDPVDNVIVDFGLDKAFFDDIPDLCKTEDADPPVDPPSSISDDGMTLTCNFGTVNMGTAIIVQTPVVANGATGEEVNHDGTIDGQTVDLPPIPIVNPFVMDAQFAGVTQIWGRWDDNSNPTYVDLDLNWSLRLGQGSDVGPPNVTYRLDMSTNDGDQIDVGFHVRDQTMSGCTRFDIANADGHPWSRTDIVPPHPASYRNTNFVDQCILTEVSPNVFTLELRGINYDILNAPTHDSWNAPLPTNWNYVASGQLWFRVHTTNAGSIALQSNAPTYEAPTGQEFTDLVGNNSTNKSYVLPGSFSSGYIRGFSGNGGNQWDDTFRTSPGTTVEMYVANGMSTHNAPPATTYGNCLVFDYDYVRWDPNPPAPAAHGPVEVLAVHDDYTWDWLEPPPGQIQYYVGPAPANPDQFDCGSDPGNWTDTPTDPSQVKAIRHLFPYSTYDDNEARSLQLRAYTKINDDVPVGTDIWQFGSALSMNGWIGPQAGNEITPTPGYDYPYTTGRRDVLVTITANPFIRKAAAQATITPGVPADFTLTYSATGSGSIPDTVDGYQIVDTLPPGMTYVVDSADPPPSDVSFVGGQQVLTWNLDDVETNVQHELAYQAVADPSVEPGTVMTNTAQSSLEGELSPEVSESVTTTTNGYTIILKTADVDYIPNAMGDGVGTGSWTVMIDSFDPLPQAFTDTIDILPYNGDQRGTSFSGSYTLDEVVLPDGGTVYYTDADPTTLSDDPDDPSNGTRGDPTGNTVEWTTERPLNPTAIRVIGGELPAGGEFSFQVVITTDGAQPQDVFVNRAQARAEHTELVMRTSAPLVVTDYEVLKTSDPESGSTVNPGDVVTYTVTVTQVGDVPAGALFTDTLTEVFDDAIYNEDVTADLGDVSIEGDVLSWSGDIPVGEVATITYSVTMKDMDGLAADGDLVATNVVWSPGCRMPEDCTTTTYPAWYEYSKTSDPESGSTVQVDEEITYSVEITHFGEVPIEDAIVTDDLSAVLDDATWNDNASVPVGEVVLEDTTLTWTGDLEPGDVITLTYTVTVHDEGDNALLNVVTSPDEERSRCVPAPDENEDCTTNHELGDYEVVKTSDPESGSEVDPGDEVTYTVTLTHVGIAQVPDAYFDDDMSDVLDDATYNDDVSSSAGDTSYEEPTLSWTGVLNPGDEVTVTYSVTVNSEGDRHLLNVVTTGGKCLPAEGQDLACTTEHFDGAFTFSKTSDPKPGTTVEAGDVVDYTVTVEPVGEAPVEGASIEDDLSDVLDDAAWNGDQEASSGAVGFSGTTLSWSGDLEIGEVVTLTYSVTVGDSDANLLNVVTTDDERGVCGVAGDGNPDCTTEHPPPDPNDPDDPSDPSNPSTSPSSGVATATPSPVTPAPVPVTG